MKQIHHRRWARDSPGQLPAVYHQKGEQIIMYRFENRDAKSRTIVIISVAAVALLVALGVYSIVHMLHKPASAEASVQSSGLVYDASAVEGGWETLSQEEIEASLNAKVQEGMINISMNTSPVFADGKAQGNLMIVNETVNRYPQRVVITLADTGEIIYASGAIPVGSKIEADTLDVALHAGTYPCIAMFHSLDPDTGAILGSAGANINITILN